MAVKIKRGGECRDLHLLVSLIVIFAAIANEGRVVTRGQMLADCCRGCSFQEKSRCFLLAMQRASAGGDQASSRYRSFSLFFCKGVLREPHRFFADRDIIGY